MFRAALTILLACVSCTVSPAEHEILREDLKAAIQVDREILDPGAKIPALRKRLTSMLVKVRALGLERALDDDVRDLLDAAALLAFYSNDPSDVTEMRGIFNELERRSIVSTKQREQMLDSYVAARMFDDAANFEKLPANSGLAKVPTFRDRSAGRGTTLMQLSADGSVLSRHDFELSKTPQVLVIGSPWCHFSQDATRAIEADARLSAAMTRDSLWIVPQQVVHDLAQVAEWNRRHPASHMEVAYARSEWPWVKSWQTPQFYFFNNGKLVTSLVGWPDGSQKARLSDALELIGAMPRSHKGPELTP